MASMAIIIAIMANSIAIMAIIIAIRICHNGHC